MSKEPDTQLACNLLLSARDPLELMQEHRPNSSDPDFWKVWTRESDRNVDWDEIAKQWRRQPPNEDLN